MRIDRRPLAKRLAVATATAGLIVGTYLAVPLQARAEPATTPVAVATAHQSRTWSRLLDAHFPWLSSSVHVTPAESAPTPTPPKSQQIGVLAAALKNMESNYSSYVDYEPGPVDILDYGIGDLWLKGVDGAGTTVAVIEGWDYPPITTEVASFDKVFGLPNPTIDTIFPTGDGKLPAKCPAGMQALGSYGSCSAWAGELTLDVITVHLIAPYAKIVIAVAPADSQESDDAASQVAPPEMMQAIEVIAHKHLANVISISDDTGESTYSDGPAEVIAQDPGELAAAASGIPVLVGSGDCGVVQNLAVASSQCGTTSSGPDTAAWDDSPWVTAVGGTTPHLSSTGQSLGPDTLWNVSDEVSSGAGYSSVYPRPAYQNFVAGTTGSAMRAVPDVVLDASDGTSEATPMLGGVLALATQMNGGNVGPINPALYYNLGPKGEADGIVDVVSGNDTSDVGGHLVPGFASGKGYDVASGWGTIYAPKFVPALVAVTRADKQDSAIRADAATELTTLSHNVTLSPRTVARGGTEFLEASGLLPGHPVQLRIDGKLITTLTVSNLGTVTYSLVPSSAGLAAGVHAVSFNSMLIDGTGRFAVG